MRPGTRLAIILASIILFWGVVGYLVFRGDNPKKRAVEVAELALKASVDNPKSVRIIGISQPDSVFGKEYITMDEKMSISMAMMKINEKVMKLTDGLENFNPDDKEIAGLMERQMEAMSVLRSITPQANDNITKSFTVSADASIVSSRSRHSHHRLYIRLSGAGSFGRKADR